MKARAFDPHKLDLAVFIREAEQLAGTWPAAALPRLADAAAPEAPAAGWPAVQWTLAGETRQPAGGKAQAWLRLTAQAQVWQTCQRCLKPVADSIEIDRWIRFVDTEAEAAALDVDSEDDVLALPRHLDTAELIEDELLLALPLVPRHAVCEEPLPVPADDTEPALEERPNPFAALAALKRPG